MTGGAGRSWLCSRSAQPQLGVHDRLAAVLRAQDLGLLEQRSGPTTAVARPA